MERLSPFETQKNSEWFREMALYAANDIGYHDKPWVTRALIALKPAGLVGKRITVNELRDALMPFVGKSPNIVAVNQAAQKGVRFGIMQRIRS